MSPFIPTRPAPLARPTQNMQRGKASLVDRRRRMDSITPHSYLDPSSGAALSTNDEPELISRTPVAIQWADGGVYHSGDEMVYNFVE
jgi:hypothetical protein